MTPIIAIILTNSSQVVNVVTKDQDLEKTLLRFREYIPDSLVIMSAGKEGTKEEFEIIYNYYKDSAEKNPEQHFIELNPTSKDSLLSIDINGEESSLWTRYSKDIKKIFDILDIPRVTVWESFTWD